MKIKNPETGEVIVIPQGMEDAVRDAIESGNDPIEAMQMKYGGIHINPANKGKFNATKKATGKTTEELTHSKNPLTRKRAIFAQNASRWKHQDGGQAMQQQQQQQPQGGGQEDQMQQLIQMAEQALAQGASPEEVAQMLVQQGVPEQVVQQVIQYAIQDLQQQQQAQGQNPEEQMQQQNPQEEQAEMGYGGYMQGGGNGLSKEATMALQNPNIRSQPYINGAYETFMKTGDTNALNDYNAYTEANKYLLQQDSAINNYVPYGNAPKQRFIQKGYGGMSMYNDGGMAMYGNGGMSMYEEGGMNMYGNGGQLPESLLRTRMRASGATSEEINNYLTENYNYGGMTMYGHGGMIKRADGSYSKRGLWDNIRANKGSGRAPTKEMLEQESKIRAREAAYGGAYGNGGGIDNPGFRALPAYVQQDIINNMRTGGKFLRKAENGVYDDNSSYRDNPNDPNSAAYNNFTATNMGQPRPYQEEIQMDKMPLTSIQSDLTGYDLYGYDKANPLPSNMDKVNPMYPMQYHGKNYDTSTPSKTNNKNSYNYNSPSVGGSGYFNRGINNLNSAANSFIKGSQIKRYGGLHRMDPGGLALSGTSSNATWGQGLGNLGTGTSFTSPPPTAPIDGFQMDPNQAQEQLPLDNTVLTQNEASSQKPNGMYRWAAGIGKAFSNNNVNYGKGALKTTKGLEDLSKGTVEIFGNNISNRNALGDEANNLRSAMRNDYQKTGKRPTDGNAIISKYGGKMMQDGGATYADKMKVSKNSPKADFIAEKGEYIVNNGIASKLETGGSHASGNDTAISLDKSSNPSYVLSDTPRLKQLQFGGKRVSPSKYAEMATVEALGKTPDQILKAYTAFTKRAGTEGKVFGDRISDATNQLLGQKYQKDLATVKQIADQAYHKQEQLKHAMGMDNDLDHAQEVNGMSMAKSGRMQDGVHMNYFNAPAVQYGGSPQLFSDPSRLGYNTTQMAYGGLPKMQTAGNADNAEFKKPYITTFPNGIPYGMDSEVENEIIRKSSEVKGVPGMGGYRNFLENQFWEGGDMGVGNDGINVQDNNTQPSLMPTRSYKEQQKNPYSTRENPISLNSGTNNIDWGQSNWGKSIGTVGTSPNAAASYNAGQSIYPESYSGQDNSQQNNSFNMVSPGQQNPIVQPYLGQSNSNVVQTNTVPQNVSYSQTPVNNKGVTSVAPASVVSANTTAPATNANTSTTTTTATPTSNYPTYKGGVYPSGRNTPGSIKTTNDFRGTADQYTKDWGDSGLDLSGFKTAKEVQEATYKELLKTPEGRDRIREMWKHGNTKLGLDKGIGKGFDFDKLDDNQLAALLPAYTDNMLGVRTLTPVKKQPTATTTTTTKKDDEVITGDETETSNFNIEKGKERPTYDIPPANFYIPQSYGRNPIGLGLAQPQTIRPAKLNIQPELNEYNRGIRGAFRGTQGNTSVDVAQQMQGLNNLYGAQNKLYGQKYNFDEQSRMGAEQFNAQALMNTDAGNLQRIGVQQDLINRREGILDTQRRTDFQAGLENAQKENAYGLSKDYINRYFGPLSNSGNLYSYNPDTLTSAKKEKSYTMAQINKMKDLTDMQKKELGYGKYGGSLKKIKLKLRK